MRAVFHGGPLDGREGHFEQRPGRELWPVMLSNNELPSWCAAIDPEMAHWVGCYVLEHEPLSVDFARVLAGAERSGADRAWTVDGGSVAVLESFSFRWQPGPWRG